MISDKDAGDSDYNDGDEIDMLDSSLKQPTGDKSALITSTIQVSPDINKSDDAKKRNLLDGTPTPQTLCKNSK